MSTNPALHAIKSIGSSSLFLVAAILCTVSAVLSAFDAFSGSGVQSIGVDASGSVNIGGILVAVAMWLLWGTCRDRSSGGISVAGLNICKVIQTLAMVLLCILLVVLLIAGVMLLVGSTLFFDELASYVGSDIFGGADSLAAQVDRRTYTMGFGIGVLAATVIIFPLLIAYTAGTLRIIKRIKITALSGMPDNRISGFVIVINYITAISSALGSLALLRSAPLGAVATLANAAFILLVTICLQKYKKQMTALMIPAGYGYAPAQAPVSQPGYPQGQYYPYQQQAPVQQPSYQQAPYQQAPYQQAPYQQPQAPVQRPPVQQPPQEPRE